MNVPDFGGTWSWDGNLKIDTIITLANGFKMSFQSIITQTNGDALNWADSFLQKYSPDQNRGDHGRFSFADDNAGGGDTKWNPPNQDAWLKEGHLRLSGLFEDEKNSVFSYVQNGYEEMNYALRANYVPSDEFGTILQENIDNLVSLIDRNPPLPEDSILYRGVAGTSSRWSELEVGDTFQDKGFVSTSPTLQTATGFGSQLLIIEAPAETKALDTSLATNYGVRENEIILQAGTTFQVTEKMADGTIKMRVIND